MKDEAVGGAGGSQHNRVLFFEMVAGTRLLKTGVEQGISILKGVGENWKTMVTGMDSDTKAALTQINNQIAETTSKQKAQMDELVAATTESMDKRVAAAEDSAAKETSAISENLAKQVDAYETSLAKIVQENADKVAKVSEQANKEADQQIAANKRAFDVQMTNIARLRDASLSSDKAFPGSQTAGLSNIGSAIAMQGNAQQMANMNQGAQLNADKLVAIARKQAVDIEAAAQEQFDRLVALAQATSSSLLADATKRSAELIAAARATAAGIIAAQEDQNAKILAGLESEKAALGEGESAWSRLGAGAKAAGGVLAGVGMGILMVGGVLGVLFGALKSSTDAVSQWAAEIVQASEATGMGYRQVQAYLSGVEEFGVSHSIAETILVRFNKRLQENNGLFVSLGITSKNSTDAFYQFAQGVTHSTDPLAYFNTVLGGTVRSGSTTAFVDFLKKISETSGGAAAGLENVAKMLDTTGMMLSDDTVKAGALSQAVEGQLSSAFEGLKMRVGQAILPDMQALELVITALIDGTGQAGAKVGVLTDFFVNLSKWIADATGYLIGFIAGVFGVKEADLEGLLTTAAKGIDTLAQGTTDAATQMASLKNEVTGLQQSQKDLTNDTQQQTEAISNQITAIQRNQKAFDDAHDDKVKALQNEKQNYDDQLKLQDDLHQSYLVQLQDELTALQDTQNSRRQSGEDLASYETRLAEQSLQKSIQTEQNRRQTVADTMQQNIDLTQQWADAAKQAYDDDAANRIQDLQNQKTALQDNLTKQTGILQDKITQDQNILNGSADQTTSTLEGSATKLSTFIDTAFKAMEGTSSSSGLTAGNNFMNNLRSVLSDPGGTLLAESVQLGTNIGGAIAGAIGSALWNKFSTSMGDAFSFMANMVTGNSTKIFAEALRDINSASGVPEINAIGNAVAKSNLMDSGQMTIIQQLAIARGKVLNTAADQAAGLGGSINQFLQLAPGAGVPGHADGGVFSSPHISWISEGYKPEAVIPLSNPTRASAVMQQAGLGGHTFVTHFNGPVATGAVASIVMDRMASEARHKGLVFGAGI